MSKLKKVVIVGAGFGGLTAARRLSKNSEVHITIIDKRNYHLFQPLLYQVATAGLSPADIAMPIRSIFSDLKNVDVRLDEVTGIDLNNKRITAGVDSIEYDYLLLACGASHSYFGNDAWEEFAPGLKTLEQATEIRRRIFWAFEQAEKAHDTETQKRFQTFVIVGGGPTGVELAGSIAEISRNTLEKDFRKITPSRTRVILIEAGSRVLGSFPEKSSKRAGRDLESLGVQVWTSTRVTRVTEEGVSLGDEELKAKTVIWAAGVKPSLLGLQLNVPIDPMGRVKVNSLLNPDGHPNVFVIGDMAYFEDSEKKPLSGTAPVAIQQGAQVARNIESFLKGEKPKPFRYFDKGMLATIGRKKAILCFRKGEWDGFFAWLAWLFVHIYYLIGFKNRIFVFSQWAWSYFTFKKGARLIVEKEWRTKDRSQKIDVDN